MHVLHTNILLSVLSNLYLEQRHEVIGCYILGSVIELTVSLFYKRFKIFKTNFLSLPPT